MDDYGSIHLDHHIEGTRDQIYLAHHNHVTYWFTNPSSRDVPVCSGLMKHMSLRYWFPNHLGMPWPGDPLGSNNDDFYHYCHYHYHYRYHCSFIYFLLLALLLRPGQNGRYLTDDTSKCTLLNENIWISIQISLNFVPDGPVDNNSALVCDMLI